MDAAQSAIAFRAKRRANQLDPLRDGREKTKAFLVGRGQPCRDRYKRSVARCELHETPTGKPSDFSGTSRGRRAGGVKQARRAPKAHANTQ
jgi:hypothetical protein